ncbi:hypothetical protein [Flavobacterium cellulosilyticum]|uniref:hypothetical protein n=1 Tax=Flavobacterium cellulosilyticum TaxID=2541731 RepID=UPI002482194B|nr:hypothetical protein [Flavobacterium cellulosilyticum]
MDLKSNLKVDPEERYLQNTIAPSKDIDGICIGIVKLQKLPLITKESTNEKCAYIATYGLQSVFSDNLGLAVF